MCFYKKVSPYVQMGKNEGREYLGACTESACLRGLRKTVASGADIVPRHAALLVQSEARSCKRCPRSRFFEVPYSIDESALAHARMMDGKLLLVTKAPDFIKEQVIQRYKSLADIEPGFRVLKSEIEIAPIYHRLPNRVRAHAAICFIALILYRVMRMPLAQAKAELSPERVLA